MFILLGVLLGLGLADFMGLDMFQAALGTTQYSGSSTNLHWDIALTGVIIGLGSSPTHEVIQVLKEIKLNRKAENRS